MEVDRGGFEGNGSLRLAFGAREGDGGGLRRRRPLRLAFGAREGWAVEMHSL